MIYVSFIIGLVLICKGGDWFVDAASYIAKAFGIPKYVIGATIVSFATTMPEMIVSVAAALKGKSVMAIGNAVGSVSANTGLILGISLLFLPAAIRREEYLTKNILYLGCLILLLISFSDGVFGLSDCVFLLLSGSVFLFSNVKNAMPVRASSQREKIESKDLIFKIIFFVFGAAAIVAGSELLIQSACDIARQFHIPENVISVTILAMGTSLPEFVTTITAIVKKESSLSVGNIVGANVIDTAFILPVCTLLTGNPLAVSDEMRMIDLPICLVLSASALVPMLFRGKIKRMDGVTVLMIYLIYFVYITMGIFT